MERHLTTKLSMQKIRDIALDRDIHLNEKDSKKEILNKLFGDFSNIYQPVRYIAIEFLPIEDIMNLSATNRAYRELYENENTWNILMKRDFNVNGTLEMYKEAYLTDLERLRKTVMKQAMENIDPKKKTEWKKIVENAVIRKGTKQSTEDEGFYIEFSYHKSTLEFPMMYSPFGSYQKDCLWTTRMVDKIKSHLEGYKVFNSIDYSDYGYGSLIKIYFVVTK